MLSTLACAEMILKKVECLLKLLLIITKMLKIIQTNSQTLDSYGKTVGGWKLYVFFLSTVQQIPQHLNKHASKNLST